MKTWKLTVNEEELKAIIRYHIYNIMNGDKIEPETSARIHDLTKRLNRDNGEVEIETYKTQNENQQSATVNQPTTEEWK